MTYGKVAIPPRNAYLTAWARSFGSACRPVGPKFQTVRTGSMKSNTTASACWCGGENDRVRLLRQKHFVIDGEAVVLGVDGISDFDALVPRKHDDEVQLYAFDLLALEGDDLRSLPFSMRKANLARLLARRPEGIFVAPFEQGEIGPDLFRAACRMGLEGLVSKHRDRPYQAARSKLWIKMLWGGGRRGLWHSRRSVQRHQWSAPCRNLLMRAGPSPPSSRIARSSPQPRWPNRNGW